MLIGLIKYKLAKRKVIKNMEFYVDVEDTYLTNIFNHYLDYFEYIKDMVMKRYELMVGYGKEDYFIDDSRWYIEELNKTKGEIEEVFKKERFNVQLIKAMNNKGLFTDYRKGQAESIIENFYKAKEIYETRYQTFSPELLVKEYKIKQKLKRLQGDF